MQPPKAAVQILEFTPAMRTLIDGDVNERLNQRPSIELNSNETGIG